MLFSQLLKLQGKQSIEDRVRSSMLCFPWSLHRTCRSKSWTVCWRSWRSQTSPSSRLRRHSTRVSPSLTSSKLAVSLACSSRTIFWHRHSAWLDSTFSTTSTGRKLRQLRLSWTICPGDGGENKRQGGKKVPAAVPVVLTQGTARAKCGGLSPKLWSGRGILSSQTWMLYCGFIRWVLRWWIQLKLWASGQW